MVAGRHVGGHSSQNFLNDLKLLFCGPKRTAMSRVFHSRFLQPRTVLQYAFIEWIRAFQTLKTNGGTDGPWVVGKTREE